METTTQSTSMDSTQVDSIILRETSTTRLLFKPMIVNNKANIKASVRGEFVFQRKTPKGVWIEHKDLNNNQLKAEKWIKLDIGSEEMLTLITELNFYYQIHENYGVESGYRSYSKSDIQLEKIKEILDKNESLFDTILELDDNKSKLIERAIEWMSDTDKSEEIVSKLIEIQEDELDYINNMIGIAKLKKLLTFWEENSDNNSEKFWQDILSKNTWVLSQVFSSPFLYLQQEAYVGGKTMENKEGKVVDFIYRNDLSKEVSLIEIKTPLTKLLSSEYRTGVFSVHTELTGAIVQTLGYKEQITREYAQLGQNDGRRFNVFSPQCVVIAGNLKELNDKQIQSFELYRKEMKNVSIITFDELFKRVELLLDLLSSNP